MKLIATVVLSLSLLSSSLVFAQAPATPSLPEGCITSEMTVSEAAAAGLTFSQKLSEQETQEFIAYVFNTYGANIAGPVFFEIFVGTGDFSALVGYDKDGCRIGVLRIPTKSLENDLRKAFGQNV